MNQAEQLCVDIKRDIDKYVTDYLIDIINNVFVVNIDKSEIFNNNYSRDIESKTSGYIYTIRIYYNQMNETRNIEIYKFSKMVFKFTTTFTSKNVQYDINVDDECAKNDKSIMSILAIKYRISELISDVYPIIDDQYTIEGDNK